mgnify:CR=1 FL=1
MEADKIFEKINGEVPSSFKGKIVAIDMESGKYFLGDSELDAYHKAIKGSSSKMFVFRRIGFKATHFVGAC